MIAIAISDIKNIFTSAEVCIIQEHGDWPSKQEAVLVREVFRNDSHIGDVC